MSSPVSQNVLVQLSDLEQHASNPGTREATKLWQNVISETDRFLAEESHPIVFIGKVGGGKSSLVGTAAKLIVGSTPTDRTSLKNHSVLAVGSGRTTVCEVSIRSVRAGDGGEIGLEIEPYSDEEMREIFSLYAEDEWNRLHPEVRKLDEDDWAATPQEIQRVIREMAGYAERRLVTIKGGIKKLRIVRPLDEVIPKFSAFGELAEHLLERASLSERTQTAWWWNTADETARLELKKQFEEINLGKEVRASLPRRMTVVVPEVLPDARHAFNPSLIDTRGLDGAVESRTDLQAYLRDPRALLVLCASFKDAPDADIRALLHSMGADAQLRSAIPRTLLLLADMGDADQVNGAEGDRDAGQEIKIDECLKVLQAVPVPEIAAMERSQVLAFDVLKDDRILLVEALTEGLSRLRGKIEALHLKLLEGAQLFLNASSQDQLKRLRLREQVDSELRQTMAEHLPSMYPLENPLTGLLQAIGNAHPASIVYASCRRNGAYYNLDLYAATQSEASRAATRWLDKLINAVVTKLEQLDRDAAFDGIKDYLQLARRHYLDGQIKLVQDYSERVSTEVAAKLRSDPIWSACSQEWGQGSGFIQRVVGHLEEWARRQHGFSAHRTTNAATCVPLWQEVAKPAQSPAFTLQVKNLRALRTVSWQPAALSLLIGANGTGKTTLLQTLKLLQIAYERGLPEAVKQVLGGSSNLRYWGADEAAPVELGLKMGNLTWRLELSPREGSVDYLTQESLFDGDREVFARDSLGTFQYGDEQLAPTASLGLRALMDRGVHDPAVRTIATFLRHISVYHDPDVWQLRWNGSKTTEDQALASRGTNVLTLLRRWQQERNNRHRFQFVVDGLNSAFPNTVQDMDFQEAGTTLSASFYQPGREQPTPLSAEANGVLQLLILLCQVAAAEDESLVAIDEPENGLHPYALRRFLDRTGHWARQHKLTVLLATHSTVLLDEMSATPESVFVMKSKGPEGVLPSRLDQLCDRAWLEEFKLGDLYEQGEIGSNEDMD